MFDYRKGYFKAILDMKNMLENHTDALKYNKSNNAIGIIAILSCILTDIDKFMQTAEMTEFIINKESKHPVVKYVN